jgi:hypothetical protein
MIRAMLPIYCAMLCVMLFTLAPRAPPHTHTTLPPLLNCSHALRENGLPHLYPRNAKKFEAAVAEFRSGPAATAAAAVAGSSKPPAKPPVPAVGVQGAEQPRVLLLLVKQGANGLNLTGERGCRQAQAATLIWWPP